LACPGAKDDRLGDGEGRHSIKPGEVIASKDVDECNGSCEISWRFDWQ
jgi:hypothetical protein